MINTKMGVLTWDQVLARQELIGGDIELIERCVLCRGPLASIKIDGNLVTFESPWRARRVSASQWDMWTNTPISVAKEINPLSISLGRIHFEIPFTGLCTIYPRTDCSNLHWSKVSGLESASRRLLALYPNLAFDRERAKLVLDDLGFNGSAEVIDTLGSINDLLVHLGPDDFGERFLRFYIEAVTGETGLCRKVY